MNNLCKFIFFPCILSALLTLSACAPSPQALGISEAEWNSYDRAHKDQLVSNYSYIQKINEMTDKKAAAIRKEGAAKALHLAVKISGGQVIMPPFNKWQEYNPLSFTIDKESCLDNFLTDKTGEQQVTLRVCYKNDVLYMDPSHYEIAKKDGSISFTYLPLWEEGFTYKNISSTGYTRLKNVTVYVKSMDNG